MLFALTLAGAMLPGAANALLPQLAEEINNYWPKISERPFVPAIIEQESEWKPFAKLKTSRELGIGLGQFTITYRADGSVRFDALSESRLLDPSLRQWSWKDAYNTTYQMRAVVLKLKQNDNFCSALLNPGRDTLACDASAYNGGLGGVTKRIKRCQMQTECNPSAWQDNLSEQCPTQTKVKGYGEDFCTINSKYPGRVFNRMPKYKGKI